jgi:hypothetical protein
MTTVC